MLFKRRNPAPGSERTKKRFRDAGIKPRREAASAWMTG